MGHPSASAGWPSLQFSGLVQHESTRKTRSGAASGLEAGVDRLSKGHQQSRIKNTFVLIIFCNFQGKGEVMCQLRSWNDYYKCSAKMPAPTPEQSHHGSNI